MNNQKYWEERAILKDKLLEKDIKKIEKKLLKLFKDTRKEILNELKIIYADIEATEYAKYRIDSLLASINKALDILYQNNEYAIVKSNTKYGLNVYDLIVQNASSVKTDQFIYK